jgi:small ligand-binding sensory domain FIST
MTMFNLAHTAAEDWAHAAQACADGLGCDFGKNVLGFVYVTDYLADDFQNILTYLTNKTGIVHWAGTVGIGISATGHEYFDRPALAVMAVDLPEDAYRMVSTLSEQAETLPPALHDWIARASPVFGIVHADGTNPNIPDLIDTFSQTSGCFLVGGLSASRRSNYQVADRLTGGGVSGVLFASTIEVATGLSQGCSPIGSSHIVSDCVDNVIIGIDGRRALDVFKEEIGDVLARDLNRVSGYIHAAFPIEGSDTGDYLVRSLVGIDPAQGWLAVGGEIEPGERVMFVRRDPQTAKEDFRQMLTRLKDRLPGPPKGGVYYSCIARGPDMFGAEGREVAVIHDVFGDFPLIGFYANGEISNDRLYGYTGVIALFV